VLAQIYVSTTYALLSIIFFGVWAFFMIANFFLDWSKILNVSESMKSEVTLLAIIVFTYFCLNFVFSIITTVNIANQQPARSSLISLCGQLLSLAIVVLLVKTTEGSLIKLAMAFCLSPLLVLIAANIFLYKGAYRKYSPQISKVDFSYSKGLFNLGLTFFVIQFANILQFQTANIIIAQYFGVSEVTSYNIVYKYFGVLIMVFTIFLTPFWSASTEAFLKNDVQWIKNGIRKYNQLNVLMVAIGLLMLVSSGTVYRLWLGEGKVNIDFSLSLCGFLFFNTSVFGGKYVSFLNGISALRIQFWACMISPFLYILVTVLLVRYFHMGVYALFIAAIIANFNTFILAPIQYHQIIIKNKRGIWTR
jgi:O-antigen/teichoic acid export membrane protein